ncbi:MAG: ABC transporter permease [bacterium]|nr:ABC transporter permease [bacterium]
MRNFFVLHTAIRSLTRNLSRTLLTVLGIVIGITSIILVMALGESAQQIIVGELGGLGAETIVIRPGREPSGPIDIVESLFSDSLKERELDFLGSGVIPGIVDISPEIFTPGSVAYRGETFSATILGFSAEFMERALGLVLHEGRVFNEYEINSRGRVAIIGDRVRNELFGESDALGEFVSIKGQKFRVIGIYAPRGQVVFFDVDELVLVPYTSAQEYLSGINYYNQLIVQAESAEIVPQVQRDIQEGLRALHNITDPSKDDFYIQTQQGLVDQVSAIITTFSVFLTLVVAIALVVGGIGVMNIMLVSVTERTKEIGLRKALGATRKNILLQFLLEAVLLTGIGGVIGVVAGAVLAYISAYIISTYGGIAIGFSFPWLGAVLGVGVSGVVGLIFGIYPARKAAQKSPIEALRYE